MNAPQKRALLLDAFYQVLDNWVFRIVLVLTLVPILLTFAVGFREDEIVLLFGVERWEYGGLVSAFSGGASDSALAGADLGELRGSVIEAILQIVFDYLAGGIGVVFCIAATAFFVPRMLEKGAADMTFHKPVSRSAFWVSRYLTGLLFVAGIAAVLVPGMYLGLLLVSRYHDPGILFATGSLVYAFALVYSVTMLIGVLTRSTVASILLSTLFFFGNGCIHGIWKGVEQGREQARLQASTADEEQEDTTGPVLRALAATLNGLHYVLPKTGDADTLAGELRRAIKKPVYQDAASPLRIQRMAEGFERIEPERTPFGALALGEARFAARAQSDQEAVLVLWWRPADVETTTKANGKAREIRETARDAAQSLETALREQPAVSDLALTQVSSGASDEGKRWPYELDLPHWTLDWNVANAGASRAHRLIVCRLGDSIYTFEMEQDARAETLAFAPLLESVEANALQNDWYSGKMGWSSPWRFNYVFSLGSSLAFAALMLFLGWIKLERIEF